MQNTGNELLAISSHCHSYVRILLCGAVDKSWMVFINYFFFFWLHVFEHRKNHYISLHLVLSKCTKMQEQEIPSVHCKKKFWNVPFWKRQQVAFSEMDRSPLRMESFPLQYDSFQTCYETKLFANETSYIITKKVRFIADLKRIIL